MHTMVNDGDLVVRRKARSTGTSVAIVFEGYDHPDGPWSTICEDHGGVVHHSSRKLAGEWVSHPEDWCPTCKGE